MNKLLNLLRGVTRRVGIDIIRYRGRTFGDNFLRDVAYFLDGKADPMVFDVGANAGQTVAKVKQAFPGATIHSFEPGPTVFPELEQAVARVENAKAWNVGVGAEPGRLTLNENNRTDMSSFLGSAKYTWGKVVNTVDVDVITLDNFCAENGISGIDLLKSDTQGFDLEVFKGATRLMAENRIKLIFVECTFTEMYADLPPFHEVLGYLEKHNFTLVTLYELNFYKDKLGWTDALLVNRECYEAFRAGKP